MPRLLDGTAGFRGSGDVGGAFPPVNEFSQRGGGLPGTITGSTGALPNNENGGVFASRWVLFVPSQAITGGLCYIGFYDVTSFDDQADEAHYSYRVEDIIPDQTPTVNRVVLTYRDLGRAKLTFTLTGSNDDGQVISRSTEVQIGNAIPTNALLTRQVDIQLTGFRPQLTITRKPNDGPICIVAVTMKGECEEEQ